MAFCMKSELDIFSVPPIQTNVLATEQVAYSPITSLDNTSTIDFLIPGNGDTYKNLSSIYLRLILQMDTQVTAAIIPGTVNNILHSIFRQCTVYLNNVQISQDSDYHYKSFLLTLLNYGSDASSTHLKTTGWELDVANIDSITMDQNPVLQKRKNLFSNGKKVEVIGKLCVDIFNQPKFLLNSVDIKISLTREKPAFYIMEEPNGTSDLKILEANLFIDQVHVNPSLLLAHHKILATNTAKYPFKKIIVRQFTINANSYSLNLDNLVIGQLPNVVVFTMTTNEAYTGARARNPFNFQNFDLNQFALFVNGRQVPNKPLKFSFNSEDGNLTSRGYNTLFKGTGIHHFDRGHMISKELYDSSYFMLAFDLTPDHSHNSDCINPLQQGTLRIEGTFGTSLTHPITCLILCEFDSMLEIDESKNVKITI